MKNPIQRGGDRETESSLNGGIERDEESNPERQRQ